MYEPIMQNLWIIEGEERSGESVAAVYKQMGVPQKNVRVISWDTLMGKKMIPKNVDEQKPLHLHVCSNACFILPTLADTLRTAGWTLTSMVVDDAPITLKKDTPEAQDEHVPSPIVDMYRQHFLREVDLWEKHYVDAMKRLLLSVPSVLWVVRKGDTLENTVLKREEVSRYALLLNRQTERGQERKVQSHL